MTCDETPLLHAKTDPLGEHQDEAGQSHARAIVKRSLGATRVWPWRITGSRWRGRAVPSALAHCVGRFRRADAKYTLVYHLCLGVIGQLSVNDTR